MSKTLKTIFIAVAVLVAGWALYASGIFKSICCKPVAEKPKVIGILRYVQQLDNVEKGFYQGMEKLGYAEGKNVHYIITPYGESPAKMQGLAQGLIDQHVDLIMAITNVAATGAKQATKESARTDIPIVFSHASSPDATGLIESFKSSGNNLTGVAVDFVEITAKKLDFLKRINPSIKRVGVIDAAFTDPAGKLVLGELRKTGPKLGMEIVSYKVASDVGAKASAEITAVANKIKPGDIDAFFYVPGPIVNIPNNVQIVVDMVNRLKIPAVYHTGSQVNQGGLFSYAPNLIAMGEQTAVFVNKILGNQKPGDIPVEIASKNILTLNLKTSEQAGIKFPDSMLSIAEVKIDK